MVNLDDYIEKEIKILDVNVEELQKKLEKIGAKKVFDDDRIITAIDTEDKHFLKEEDKLIRITEEGNTKITMHVNQSNPDIKREIKFKTSGLKETKDFFIELGLKPISKVKAHRISYELEEIDFDIDFFPVIPPFLEIDTKNITEMGYTVESLIEALGLKDNKIVIMGTEDIHKLYNIDYFEVYKAND